MWKVLYIAPTEAQAQRIQQLLTDLLLPAVEGRFCDAIFMAPLVYWQTALLCDLDGLQPLLLPHCHCVLFHGGASFEIFECF